MSCAQPTFISS